VTSCCTPQLSFSFYRRAIRADFSGGQITSDGSWSHQRRICYKADHTAVGTNLRFLMAKAKKLISNAGLDGAFDPTFWKSLSFFALVKPDGDILPVRTVYSDNGKTQNIGPNYLKSEKPIWYTTPDLIASKLRGGPFLPFPSANPTTELGAGIRARKKAIARLIK